MANYNSDNGYAKRKNDFTSHITKFTIWNHKNGAVQDVRPSVRDIQWDTDLKTAAQLTFKVQRGRFPFIPWNGDQVQFAWDGHLIFTGWIFKRKLTDDDTWDITAYANSRYLKGTGAYAWPATSSSDRFQRIANDLGLKNQVVDRNGYKVAAEITDGKTFFDMIDTTLDETVLHTGKRYMVFDDPDGTIKHVSLDRLSTNLLIGDNANVSSWDFEASIEDTSNIIQVVHEDSKTKQRELRVARSNSSVDEWGPLVHTETESGDVNSAQLQDKANALLREKNKEKKTLNLKVIGDSKIRAGSSLYLSIWELSGVGVPKNQHILVTSASHKFDNPWTMDLGVELI